MDHLHRLHELFRRFPGIGPRQAKRFVFFLLAAPMAYRKELADEIAKLESRVTTCTSCYRFFDRRSTETVCSICSDRSRSTESLMIVAKDVDLEAVEKSRVYTGRYFVLGDTIPLFEGKHTTSHARSKELLTTVERAIKNGLREIILAFSLNAEGEHTKESIEALLSPITQTSSISVYTLGRGLSTGTELEYSDSETIKNALLSKKKDA